MIALLALHVVSAVIWVGGIAFAYLVLRPSVGPLDAALDDPGARRELHRPRRDQAWSGQNCSDSLSQWIQHVHGRGALINGAKMERFIRSQNVERFRRLLERVTEESDRQKIMNLLADELQKQKDAGDPR